MADNKRKHDDSQAPPSLSPTCVSPTICFLSPVDGSSAHQQTSRILVKEKALEIATKKPRVEDCIDGSETIKKILLLLSFSNSHVTKDAADPPNPPVEFKGTPEPEQISKAEQESSQMQDQDCAMCLYEKKTCPIDCPFAPYFPRNRKLDFMICVKVYGVEQLKHMINQVEESEKEETVHSLVNDAVARFNDPVGGSDAIIRTLRVKLLEAHTKLISLTELRCKELENIEDLERQLLFGQFGIQDVDLLHSRDDKPSSPPKDEELSSPTNGQELHEDE